MESLPASSLLQELRASLPSSASQLPANSMPLSVTSMPLSVSSMPSPLTMFSSPLLDSSSSLSLAAHQVNSLQVFDQKIYQRQQKIKQIKYLHDYLSAKLLPENTKYTIVCIESEQAMANRLGGGPNHCTVSAHSIRTYNMLLFQYIINHVTVSA